MQRAMQGNEYIGIVMIKPPLSPPNASDASAQPRWQPTHTQLDTPEKMAIAFKQLLTQHYALVDAHAATAQALTEAQAKLATPPPNPPRGLGPADTVLLGIPVAPVDTQQLATGATLKYDKVNGRFAFS